LDPGPDLLPYVLRLLGEGEPQKPAAADEPTSDPKRSPLGRVMRLAEPARQLIQGECLIYAFHNIAHRFALEGCATAVDLSSYAPDPVLNRSPDQRADPVPSQPGILDYLPPPEALPEGIYLLLTSRPGGLGAETLDRCPDWIWRAAQECMAQGGPFEHIDLKTDHPGYRILLAAYFHRELAETWVSTARESLGAWLDHPAQGRDDTAPCQPEPGQTDAPGPAAGGADPLRALSEIRDRDGHRLDRRIQDTWIRLLAERGLDGPKDVPPTVLHRLRCTFETLFDDLFTLADRRFLYPI